MTDDRWIAAQFEEHRAHLEAVAYRMLGSQSEADDAVQEAWLRLSRANATGVENLGGWLTTVVGRVCLDMLRSRKSRREEAINPHTPDPADPEGANAPERETLLAESVGLALLVVLERLAPAERLAFVLHDMFALSFDEIAPIVGRTSGAARQLASRARRRVQGNASASDAELQNHRAVVTAFLAASRRGNFDALVAVLAPDVVLRAEMSNGEEREIRSASAVAGQALTFAARAQLSHIALVNGAVGVIVAPKGRLLVAFEFEISGEQIARIDVITRPERLQRLDLAVLRE